MPLYVVVETTTKKLLTRKETQAEANAFAAEDSANRQAAVGDKESSPRAAIADASGSWWFYDGGAPDNEAFYEYPPPTAAATREAHRTALYRIIANNMKRLPAVFAKDADELTRIHALITKVVACARQDGNMDSAAIRAHITTTASYDFLDYIKDWKRASNPTGTSWDAYLSNEGASADTFATPNATTGAPEAQSTVTVPNGWNTMAFEPFVYDYLK